MHLVDHRRVGRTALATAGAAALLILAGCGAQDTAGPEIGVTAQDVQEPENFYEGDYLGQRVTVSAAVAEVIDADSIELAAQGYGDDSLLVRSTEPVDAAVGDVVRVTGTVGQYQTFLEEEGVPPVQYDMYEEYETEAYLYDAVVERLPS